MTTTKIHEAILAVMQDIDAIGKTRNNVQQSYKFRGIDEVYNALHPLLKKHGVFTVPTVLEERREERQSKSGGVLIYTMLKVKYEFFAGDGSHVDAVVVGEGMDSGDKSANKAMAGAHKYALVQVFAIPTEDAKDSEDDHHEVVAKPSAAPVVPKPAEKPQDSVKDGLLKILSVTLKSYTPEDAESKKRFTQDCKDFMKRRYEKTDRKDLDEDEIRDFTTMVSKLAKGDLLPFDYEPLKKEVLGEPVSQ